MKKLIFFAIIGLISLKVYSQEVAPKVVLESFQSKFSKVTDVKWKVEKPEKWETEKQAEWEAEFKMNGENISASFIASGKWLETEKELSKKDLPANVFKRLSRRFNGFKIEEVASIETNDFKGFEIELEKSEILIEVLITKSEEITIKDVKVEEDDDEEN